MGFGFETFRFLQDTSKADCRFAKPACVGPSAIGDHKLWRMESREGTKKTGKWEEED
jgi:hypothetical protein